MAGYGKKNVGIVTFHFVSNYGAVWQAYALQEKLVSMGHDVRLVDYRPKHVFDGGSFWIPWSRWRLKADVVIAYQKYVRWRRRLAGDTGLHDEFQAFIAKFLRMTSRRYTTLAGLRRNPVDCDVLICGSDQIWNPSVQFGVDAAYFLDFASPKQKRVSYAASFGRADVEPRHKAALSDLISNFDAVSVREESGAVLCLALTNRRDVVTVPDPTLLRNDYSEAETPKGLPDRYLFSYVLRSGDAVGAIQRRLATECDLKVVTAKTAHGTVSDHDVELRLSPCEWLGAIRESKMVVTNSFHGTIFSILFRRPFLTVSIGSGKHALNERAAYLLKRLGLEDRFLNSPDPESALRRMEAPIDWDSVQLRLEAWRDEADIFLEQALAFPDIDSEAEKSHGRS